MERVPDPRMIPRWQVPSRTDRPPDPPPTPHRDADAEDNAVVRPFIVTGGRTQPLYDDLVLETVVGALPAALSAPLSFERRRIVELCQRPRSIAEIAALLGIPFGVARVLVSDLSHERLVHCQAPGVLPLAMLERIRDLVRAL